MQHSFSTGGVRSVKLNQTQYSDCISPNDINSNWSSPLPKMLPMSSFQSTTLVGSPDGLELAGRMLEWHLKNDNSFPQVTEQLRLAPDVYTVSGLTDVDYPTLEAGPSGQPLLKQTGIVNRIPLPPELVEHFGHMQSYCMMGLFPDIQRAWLSIDSDIYVWTYEDGGDLAYFDGLAEPIIAVELVRPKPGIFQPHIQYLLCLATTVEIVLLGVSFTGSMSNYQEMHLLPEPLFAIPTDGAYIVTISGTLDGRIFMGAKDGCVYEFFYQAEEGFFGRKCRKINHSKGSLSFLIPSFINAAFAEEDPIVQLAFDSTRHILYTRSEKGSLQAYDLGADGQSMVRVAQMNLNTIIQAASNIARTVDRSSFKPLVSISALESSESTHMHLVAVTAFGVRLYFTAVQWRSYAEVTPSARPNTLQLVHVRLPPGYAANAPPQRPHQVHSALYNRGTLLLATTPTSGDNDVLWTLSNSLFSTSAQLSETQNTLQMDGKAWALCEVPQSPPKMSKVPPAPEPPLLVTQHTSSPRRFVLLTTQCCHVVTQLRPVDILRQLLVEASGPDSTAIRAFFQVLREDQACATALILACSTSVQDVQVADWATQTLFLHGGEVRVVPSGFGVTTVASPGSPFIPSTPTPLHQSYSTFTSPIAGFNPNAISTPQLATSAGYLSAGDISTGVPSELQYSGRHNGLYLYFGRIIRPLWMLPLAREVGVGRSQLLDSVVTCDELISVIQQLNNLRSFVHRHIGASSALAMGVEGASMAHKGRVQEAQLQERKSLAALKQLLNHTAEVLSLWKVLCDHQLHLLGQGLSTDLKSQLKTMLFRDLVLAGGDVCVSLINALIHRYLDDAASTDAISGKLREVCPSLYRNEDALCTKVNEQLLKARSEMNRHEKERILQQTLEACKQIPTRLNLAHVCQQLAANQYFAGVVELCIVVADKRDPHKRALQYYQNESPDDQAGLEALLARKECYQQICLVLQQLLTMAACHPQSPSVPKSPGPLMTTAAATDAFQFSPAEAQRLADETLQLALQSGDELCHVAIFDWLMDKKWDDKLLELQSPYLENYLKRQTAQQEQPELVAKYDLLWKYYEKSNNLIAAARVLSRLADAHSTAINLNQRIEYLSRSIACARAAETSFGNAAQGQFLYELEEKMDVAKVQWQVMDAASHLSSHTPGLAEAISRLNSDLLDVTQLYEQFAEPLGLWECKLAILHCAGHYDAALVANVWLNIINSELKKVAGSLDANTKIASVSNKIRHLGKLYATSEQFFPLDLIIKTLESHSVQWDGTPGWVVASLMSVGVPITRLLATYRKLIDSKEAVGAMEGKPNHLLSVVLDLLNRFADSPSLVPAAERRAFAGQCLDATTRYLSELYCTAHATSAALIAEFRNVQAKIERL